MIHVRGMRIAVACGIVLQTGRPRVRFPMLSLKYFTDLILLAALWPWDRSDTNRNEYQEYFLRSKGGRGVGLTSLSPSCADCLENWKHQPAGNLRACPGLYRDFFSFLCISTDTPWRWLSIIVEPCRSVFIFRIQCNFLVIKLVYSSNICLPFLI